MSTLLANTKNIRLCSLSARGKMKIYLEIISNKYLWENESDLIKTESENNFKMIFFSQNHPSM